MSTAAETPRFNVGPSSARTIQNLAPEIIDNIISKVRDKVDLKNLRLVSKDLDAHARRKLFEEVILKPDGDSISHWESTADHAVLSQIPRRALIQSREDVEDWEGYDEVDEPDEEYQEAVEALSKFPRLSAVEIAFTPICVGVRERVEEWAPEVSEDVWQRLYLLEWVFRAIRNRKSVEGASPIRSLTLRHLQNFPYDKFPSSKLFFSVMQQLEELHVGLVQEYNRHGPDHDYSCIELITFPPHFCSMWLQPIAPNLKALSLYSTTDNWGCFPGYFDPSAIVFPKLETLSLGYYTLAYDDQLDWLLNKCKSLTTLVLHNCMIVRHMSMEPRHLNLWNASTRGWQRVSPAEETSVAEHAYNGRWSDFFDKIAAALPNLREFRFDQFKEYGVNNRHLGGARAYPARYVTFSDGILPDRWEEAKDDGTIDCWSSREFKYVALPNYHEETLEEDQKSLDRLLELCRARREAAGK
ncbi:hypothetical protein B0T22DRAFT_296091 [Podospora appendiculata]|uniref:F-box domain-containing protein n=1 Tax=Podospora appendiculata TaxID=314037 RepID=A0AAE0X290_9PEZI|nr:hypothetical protein B0T22DRAFT_296091 [Podospora appendiculata]